MDYAERRRQQLIDREAGKTGLRGKINAKCIECIVDLSAKCGSWRQQVEACESVRCPFHSVRPTTRELDERGQARLMVNKAVYAGEMEKPDKCEECGAISNLDGHHTDYRNPLSVEWLCRPCHGKRHGKSARGRQ